MTNKKKAAHFMFIPEVALNPQNDGLIHALLECGFHVDLYVPTPLPDVSSYGPDVRCYPVEYGKRWLIRNIASPRWNQYQLFSATAESPFATVGALSLIHRKPFFFLVDEIKSGSYYGDDPEHMKLVYRWAIRRAAFCIVNDESRIPLLQDYAGITNANKIIVYPSCFANPPLPTDRNIIRAQWGIPKDGLVLGVSGGFNETAGAEWLLETFCNNPSLYLVVQSVTMPSFAKLLLQHVQGADRLYIQPKWPGWREGWREIWSAAPAIDIGLAIYLNPAPQFQHMGIASNRLCMFLAMGLPVIASRQPSFRFVEDYDCGVLVSDAQEFSAAVERIAVRLPAMRDNALRCARDYIRAPERAVALREQIARLGA